MRNPNNPSLAETLKTWLGFDDWFPVSTTVNNDNEIIEWTIGRWHGHKYVTYTFRGAYNP